MARLALAAFMGQSLVSSAVWLLVDDRSQRGSWSTTDFEQWVSLSIASAVVLAALGAARVRRLWATFAIAAGCLISLLLGWAIFVGYAVVNSA